MCDTTLHHELDAYDSVHVGSSHLHQHQQQHLHHHHNMGPVDLDYEETSDEQWEHEVDIVPPIVGKEAVLGCNGQGESCPLHHHCSEGIDCPDYHCCNKRCRSYERARDRLRSKLRDRAKQRQLERQKEQERAAAPGKAGENLDDLVAFINGSDSKAKPKKKKKRKKKSKKSKKAKDTHSSSDDDESSHPASGARRTGEQKADSVSRSYTSCSPPHQTKKTVPAAAPAAVTADKSTILEKIKNGEKVDADAIFDEAQFEDFDDEEADAEMAAFKTSLFSGLGSSLFGSLPANPDR